MPKESLLNRRLETKFGSVDVLVTRIETNFVFSNEMFGNQVSFDKFNKRARE